MDTFLIEEANKDYLIRQYFVSSGKLLRKWNVNMVMKRNLLLTKCLQYFYTFQSFKVLFAKFLTTFHFIGLSTILIKSFESFSKLCNFIFIFKI